MSTTRRPARDWHLADVIIPTDGNARTVTLHRLEGAPARAVVMYDHDTRQCYLPPDHTEIIARNSD